MQEVSQIKCENAAAFVQKIRVLWNGGQTNWSKNYSTSQSLTIDLTSCNIPDRTEVWIEVQAVLGKTKESPEHVLYFSKSPCEAIYRTTGATLSFKVEFHGLILNESKAMRLRVEQLREEQSREIQLRREQLRQERLIESLKTSTLKKIELQQGSAYYFISNAGLCLLKDWFPMLFRELGYMKDHYKFKDTESQIRAVFLMQYLTYLKEKTYTEKELMFNRLIVGLPMDVPLPMHFALTQEEKGLADRLESVVTSLSIINRIPIGDFQNLFIQRVGLLEQRKSESILTIEGQKCDIMINPSCRKRLDWISLPWLKYQVKINWQGEIE